MLDLFAGTGSVGIEALSRGAAYVHLNDSNRNAVNAIRANLVRTHLEQNAHVTQMDAFVLLKKVPVLNFDYIYVAPPQYKKLWIQAMEGIDSHPGGLAESAWVIVQIDPVEYQQLTLKNLLEFDLRRYGSTQLIFYEHKSASG